MIDRISANHCLQNVQCYYVHYLSNVIQIKNCNQHCGRYLCTILLKAIWTFPWIPYKTDKGSWRNVFEYGLTWRNGFALNRLLVLVTTLNHWLFGSQLASPSKHLQLFVTMLLLSESTSRQTDSPFFVMDESCIFDSDNSFHREQ